MSFLFLQNNFLYQVSFFSSFFSFKDGWLPFLEWASSVTSDAESSFPEFVKHIADVIPFFLWHA